MLTASVRLVVLAVLPFLCAAGRPKRSPEWVIRHNCVRCHRLDVIQAQRLSREEWESELNKMTRMGAKIPDRAALLDYLVRRYGPDDQPRK